MIMKKNICHSVRKNVVGHLKQILFSSIAFLGVSDAAFAQSSGSRTIVPSHYDQNIYGQSFFELQQLLDHEAQLQIF